MTLDSSLSKSAANLEKKILIPPDQLRFLAESGKTFVRWGDGETRSAFYRSLSFQRKSISLSFWLHRLLMRAGKTNDFIIGLPLPFILSSLREKFPAHRLKIWDPTLKLLAMHIRKETVVLDSFLFRTTKGSVRTEPQHTLVGLVNELGDANYGVVASQNTLDLLSGSLPVQFETFVIPGANAYGAIDRLISEVLSWCDSSAFEPVLLVSGGPAAKVLAFRLSPRLRVIDVGQFFLN